MAIALVAYLGCSDDSQPDPPDMAGAGGGDACPRGLPESAVCATDAPSYALDVGPIVEQRCATCHYPGNTQSRYVFTEHDDLYSERQTVLTRIYACVMPPAGAPSLSPVERQTLLAWLVCGAPDN